MRQLHSLRENYASFFKSFKLICKMVFRGFFARANISENSDILVKDLGGLVSSKNRSNKSEQRFILLKEIFFALGIFKFRVVARYID